MNDRPFLAPSYYNDRRRVCMLIVTHDCNLNCTYCYESFKDRKRMDFSMAQRILLREIEFVKNSNEFDELQVDFMGGEPLMNFDLIKDVVEWLESRSLTVPFVCFASTNGTLLDENRKKWFRQHKDTICLSVSYDGTEAMQEENRHTKNSKIDLDFFYDLWPHQSLHMTVSRKTLPNLFEGVKRLMTTGWEVEVALAQGEDWTREDALILTRELKKFSKAYFQGEIRSVFNVLQRDVFSIGDRKTKRVARKYCGTGTNMITYEIDGSTYGCHMFTPLVLGPKKALELKEYDFSSGEMQLDERCHNCVLAEFCSTCMGFNYRYRGSLEKKDMRFCIMNLAIAKCVCEFQAMLLSQKSTYYQEDAEYAKAVISAFPILEKFDCEYSEDPFVLE